MTIDEYRAALGRMTEEGADIAAVTDTLMTDYAERLTEAEQKAAEIAEKAEEVTRLTVKVNELAATNLKLIDKIKYHEDDKEEPENEEITIENLFD